MNETITLLTSTIVDDGSTQMRASISDQTVREYKDAMESGDIFPPIEVLYDEEAGNYILVEGHHRLKAAREAEFPRIDAVVLGKGNGQLAQRLALKANAKNSLRRTIADREKCILICISHPDFADSTEQEIADATATSRREVFRVRQKHEQIKNPERTRDHEYEAAIAIIKEDSPKLADSLAVGIVSMQKEEIIRLATKPSQERKALIPVMAEQRLTLKQAEKAVQYTPSDPALSMSTFYEYARRNDISTFYFEGHTVQCDFTFLD